MAEDFVAGDAFHSSDAPIYRGALEWAVNKSNAGMAKVVYDAVHRNDSEQGDRAGHGRDYATWIFSEEAPKSEGLFESDFELMIDARLEPDAAIGLHRHSETEEVYDVLEGELTMTTVAPDGREATQTLRVGDAHFVRRGQGHCGKSGPTAARFIAVAKRVR